MLNVTARTSSTKSPLIRIKSYLFILVMLCTYTAQSQVSGVDLELSMMQSIEAPVAFSPFSRTVVVTNTGTQTANNIMKA